jgi:uncharacterized membrane protein YqhA
MGSSDMVTADGAPTFIRGDSHGTIARLLGSTRLFIAVAVLGLIVSSVAVLIYGTLLVFRTIWDVIANYGLDHDGAKAMSVQFVELTDLFLVGTVLYIVGLGLYELFIDPEIPLPRWLHVDSLDDLKSKLIGVIIVLLGVNFLVAVVDWDGTREILHFGAAIAVVIGALALSSWLTAKAEKK